MKHLFILLIFLPAVTACFGQFKKSTSFRATANFNLPLDGLGTNDAGAGFGFDASFFSKSRLQALVEISTDRFIGDKLLVIDTVTGKRAKNAAIYSIKAGPQFFITNRFAFAATYGAAWHIIRDFNYTKDDGFKYSITALWGKQKRLITKLFMVSIPANGHKIQYLGFAAGFGF